MYYQIHDLIGKTFTEVREANDGVQFIGENGSYSLHHQQSCCESVYLEDVCGDLSDLEGTPILDAAEVSNGDEPPLNKYDESYTWTFYRLSTIKGTVTLRFYGSSNGYYSESVDLYGLN